MSVHNCFKGISGLNRCEILALANLISMLLSDGLDSDDLNMLGSLLNIIGDLITAFSGSQEAKPCNSDNAGDNKTSSW